MSITVRKSPLTGHWIAEWGTGSWSRQGFRRWRDAMDEAARRAAERKARGWLR